MSVPLKFLTIFVLYLAVVLAAPPQQCNSTDLRIVKASFKQDHQSVCLWYLSQVRDGSASPVSQLSNKAFSNACQCLTGKVQSSHVATSIRSPGRIYSCRKSREALLGAHISSVTSFCDWWTATSNRATSPLSGISAVSVYEACACVSSPATATITSSTSSVATSSIGTPHGRHEKGFFPTSTTPKRSSYTSKHAHRTTSAAHAHSTTSPYSLRGHGDNTHSALRTSKARITQPHHTHGLQTASSSLAAASTTMSILGSASTATVANSLFTAPEHTWALTTTRKRKHPKHSATSTVTTPAANTQTVDSATTTSVDSSFLSSLTTTITPTETKKPRKHKLTTVTTYESIILPSTSTEPQPSATTWTFSETTEKRKHKKTKSHDLTTSTSTVTFEITATPTSHTLDDEPAVTVTITSTSTITTSSIATAATT